MTEDGVFGTFPDLSAPALREWQELTEQILRGIAHSLSNRAAAISAVLELSRDAVDDESSIPILASERGRVQELLAVVRAITESSPGVEAFAPADAAREAQLVLTFHSANRSRTISVLAEGAPPIRVARWLFVRALIALGGDASRHIAVGTSPLEVRVSGDDGWLIARAEIDSNDTLSHYGRALAAAMGGEPLEKALGFRVPTLDAIRRREAR